jgi:epoxyqueuosine reductase
VTVAASGGTRAVRRWSVATTVPIRSPAASDRYRRLATDLLRVGEEAGLAAVGIAGAGVFTGTRATLHARRRAGLHGGMQFTYRNPDRSTDPGQVLAGARSLVVGAWGYRSRDPDSATPSARPVGTVARYARCDQYASLRAALGHVADRLRADGWQARVVVDDNALVDRAAAQRAGLGWYGRNTLLLLPGLGSWFVLGSVVTDAPLAPTPPAGHSAPAEGCGTCRRCRTACPTGALPADGVLDARRCLAWLLQAPGPFPVEHRAALGGRIYGCDECQEVCPVNRAGDRRRPPAVAESGSVAAVDLLALLEASDEELLAVNGRWYLADRDPRYLRRNALVALGNVGDGPDPATAAALAHWADCDDGLLAEHARWAAHRLGCGGGSAAPGLAP